MNNFSKIHFTVLFLMLLTQSAFPLLLICEPSLNLGYSCAVLFCFEIFCCECWKLAAHFKTCETDCELSVVVLDLDILFNITGDIDIVRPSVHISDLKSNIILKSQFSFEIENTNTSFSYLSLSLIYAHDHSLNKISVITKRQYYNLWRKKWKYYFCGINILTWRFATNL